MNKIWFKVSGVEVFEATGVGTIRWGIYYSKQKADAHVLRVLRIIYLGCGFYIHLPLKWYKKLTNPKEVIEKKQQKRYRSDLNRWETKIWFGYKYELFGKPNQYSLFRK